MQLNTNPKAIPKKNENGSPFSWSTLNQGWCLNNVNYPPCPWTWRKFAKYSSAQFQFRSLWCFDPNPPVQHQPGLFSAKRMRISTRSHVASHGRARKRFRDDWCRSCCWFLLVKFGCPWCNGYLLGKHLAKKKWNFPHESYGLTSMFHCNHGHVKRVATVFSGECEYHHDNIICFVGISPPHGLIRRFKAAADCASTANAMCTACGLMLVLATILSVIKTDGQPVPSPTEIHASLFCSFGHANESRPSSCNWQPHAVATGLAETLSIQGISRLSFSHE